MDTTLSVLICTYNRSDLLKLALESLVDGTEEKPDQIIVVNGGDERTDILVDRFIARRTKIDIKIIKTKNINLATSRNIGLPHCDGSIIAMTDDDAEVFPDWVRLMKSTHNRHPEAGAIGGEVLGTSNKTIVEKISNVVTFPRWQTERDVRTLPGVNISYKKEAVEKVGFQDVTLFRGEDVDYNWRIINSGYKILYDPSIKVYHHHRPTRKALIHQHYMYGRAYYLVRRKWPAMYSVYPHGLHRPKDFLKLVNFFASAFYQPFLSARKIGGFASGLSAIPLLFFVGLAWRKGMYDQFTVEKQSGK